MYYLYILKNHDNKIYIGQTNNLQRRLADHRHKEIKFTRDHGNFELVYSEQYKTQTEAMRREKQLKGWTREKKEALIAGNIERLRNLSKSKK